MLARLFCGVVTMAAVAQPLRAQAPDFERAGEEAVEILQGLVRIDTSNPPGNEIAAARYLQELLEREGIASNLYESAPGRGNLVARIRGNGSKRPVLMMGHIDVVGVERDSWSVDPFAGVIEDGYLWGRGAQDDKGMTAAAFQVFLMLKRQRVPLDRDVIFLAAAGEEGTPEFGIEYMIEEHWDEIESEFALNEGGIIRRRNGRVAYVGVATTEKVPRAMRLIARGTSGHGSQPRPDNPVVRLAAAVAKLGTWQPAMRLNETTREYFRRMAAISDPETRFLYENIENPELTDVVQETLRRTDIMANSTLRTSISPNIIRGGFRRNVIPAEAEATLDIRALPDEDIDALREEMARLIDDPLVEIVPPPAGGRPVTPPSKLDTEMFRVLEKVQGQVFPGAITIPTQLTGATDSAQLRAVGVQAYGIGLVLDEEEGSRVHGNDERVPIDGFGPFVEYIYRVIIEVAGSR